LPAQNGSNDAVPPTNSDNLTRVIKYDEQFG